MWPTEQNRAAWEGRFGRPPESGRGLPDAVRERLPDLDGKHVLHLACGTGEATADLRSLGALVSGIDPSAEALAVARERAPDAAADDDGLEAAEAQAWVAMRPINAPGETADLEGKRRLVDPRRRSHLGAEDTDADSAKTTQRTETVALVSRRLDRGVPVRLDSELPRRHRPASLPGDEDDRNALERARALLQKLLRIAGFHSADVDPADAHTGRDSRRRAGEDETEHGADHREQQKRERATLDAHARRGLPSATSARGDGPWVRGHEGVDSSRVEGRLIARQEDFSRDD